MIESLIKPLEHGTRARTAWR